MTYSIEKKHTSYFVIASTVAIVSLFCLDLTNYITLVPVVYTKSILLFVSSLCFIYLWVNGHSWMKKDIIDQLLIIFIFLLLARLTIDFVIKGQVFFVYKNTITIFVFTAGIIILPYICLRSTIITYNVSKITLSIYVALLICMLLSVSSIVNDVAEASTSGRYNGNEGVFSILFGHLGVSLFYISLCLKNVELKRIAKIPLIVFGMIIGALCMIYSGSRGPFAAFVVLGGVYVFLFTKNKTRKTILIIIMLILILFYQQVLELLNNLLISLDIHSFSRIYKSFNENDDISSGRSGIFFNAWQDFLEHPLFGKAYLLDDGSYVHNILIEQFRSLGFVGGVSFLFINVIMLFRGWSLIKYNNTFLIFYLLFVQYLIYGCFSGSIITIPQYWLFLLVVFNLYKQNGKDIRNYSHVQKQGRVR